MKKSRKNLWLGLLLALLCVFTCLGLTACGKHEHSYVQKVVNPTCTEQGYTIYKCSCGEEYQDDLTPASGHDYSTEWTVDVQPTCLVQGEKSHHCKNCDDKSDVTAVDKADHNYVNDKCTVCEKENIPEATDLTFALSDDKSYYIVTGIGTEALTKFAIPSAYDKKPVKEIGYKAFYCCIKLTSITIPDSVTSIGEYAFYGCSALTSITIPNSVTSIGEYAFSACSKLNYNEYDNAYYSGNDNNPYLVLMRAKSNSITSCTINDKTKFIADYALDGCSNLTSVTIPDSVTSIGSYAFNNCSGLTSITIPNSVTSIGSYAFYNCSELTSITIPNGVTSIGSYAFYNCSELTSITIPNGVTSIDSCVFAWCSGLTNITIPNSVTSIADAAFCGCSGLTSITIPDGVTSIADSAFADCSGLTSITIPDGVTSIANSAFANCSELTSITIPNSVTSVAGYAFDGCSKLKYNEHDNADYLGNDNNPYLVLIKAKSTSITSCTINDKTKVIAGSAFYYCSSLTSITIPDCVTIGYYAFAFCSDLTSLTIPYSVTLIDDGAFYYCNGLASVYYQGTAEQWSKIGIGSGNSRMTNATRYYYSESEPALNSDGTAYDGNYWHYTADGGSTPVVWEKENIPEATDLTFALSDDKSYYIVTGIGTETLTKFAIPSAYDKKPVKAIGDYAFSNCSDITVVTIPDSITSISGSAFSGCSKLKYNVSDNAYYLGNDNNPYLVLIKAKNTSITSCTINDKTKVIADSAFYYCSNLTSITIPDGVTSIGKEAFCRCSLLKNVTIPDNVTAINDYTFRYCSELTSITIPVGVTSIGMYAFYKCSKLTSITIPDSATSIGDYAFQSCSGLTSITIGNDVTSIGLYAFANCSGLTSITIPEGVTSIGKSAFESCSGLTSITIGKGITSINDYTFRYCSGLTGITIPEGVTSIGNDAFYFCSNLTSITIPEGVTSIGNSAFYYCSNLTSLTIPDGLTSIGSSAFVACSELTSITIPNSVTFIDFWAFDACAKLKDVYYKGTAEQWSKIKIYPMDSSLTDATRYYYSESEPALNSDGTAYDGNYWHYTADGGNTPVIWKKKN